MIEISREIIQKASTGDMISFEELYTLTSSYVYSVALRITTQRENAEEVTQDVFLKLYDNLKYFKFQSSFKTWLYRITVNTALTKVKKYANDMARRSDFDTAMRDRGYEEESTQRLVYDDNKILVKKMLKALNPDQRSCVVLRDIEGFSYDEIAKILHINVNTVRTRLKRGRDLLVRTFRKGVMCHEM
ncbi:MAG: RNA polymerase sigma factor [Candidatus Omnitrophica bacterium]|nr:RNA polymerase sigma factor [Candidatus Omnitrophota bacterium]